MTTATYTITMIDSDTAPAWLSLCADRGGDAGRQHSRTVDGAVQDLYTMTVTTEQPAALEAALDADESVIEYEAQEDPSSLWWAWHDQDSSRWSPSHEDAEARCAAWVAGESDDGPAR